MSKKFANSWGSQDTTAISSRTTRRKPARYYISHTTRHLGTGYQTNRLHSKLYTMQCATNLYNNNPTSQNHPTFLQTHRLMAWAPYSHQREKLTSCTSKHP